MRILISAFEVFDEKLQKNYLPIILSSEGNSVNFSWWAPTCFPNRIYCEVKKEDFQSLLSSEQEIGRYYPYLKLLHLDRKLFLHYLLSGCDLSHTLRKLLIVWVQENLFFLDRLDRLSLSSILSHS